MCVCVCVHLMDKTVGLKKDRKKDQKKTKLCVDNYSVTASATVKIKMLLTSYMITTDRSVDGLAALVV